MPNPTTGNLVLAGPVAAIDQVRIIDPLGRTVRLLAHSAAQQPIDLSDCTSGIYLVEITQGAQVERLKILKQ